MARKERFLVLEGRLAICKLAPASPSPAVPESAVFWSLTQTPTEMSLVCEEALVPACESVERGWRALRVEGPLDFSLQGVLCSLLNPLAEMHCGVFVISTYDTDYILVKELDLEGAVRALGEAGHQQIPQTPS